MKRTATALLLVLALSALAADSTTKHWEKTYAGIGRMFNKRDMAAFEKTLDKDFFFIGVNGNKMDRAAFIKAECDPIAAAKWCKNTVKVTSVKASGGKVAVGYDWHYSMPDPSLKGKKNIVGEEIGTDSWHKVGGRWLTYLTVVSKSTEKTVPVK
jgi:hypothetical protein